MEEVIAQSGKFTVDNTDYRSLAIHEDVTSGIIDFFLNIMKLKWSPGMQSRVHIVSSFMYDDLSIKGDFPGWNRGKNAGLTEEKKRHLRVEHYFEGVDIFAFSFIIIACHVKIPQGHWVLAFVRFADAFKNFEWEKMCEIIVLDSQRDEERADIIFQHLQNWLVEEYIAKSKLARQLFKFAKENVIRISAMVS